MTGLLGVLARISDEAESFHAPPWYMVLTAVVTLILLILRHRLQPSSKQPGASDSNGSNVGDPDPRQTEFVERLDPGQPMAVFLVGGDHGLGPAAIRIFQSTYSRDFRQVLFLAVGILDYEVLDSGVGEHGHGDPEKPKHLKLKTRLALDPYLALAHELGLKADCRVAISTDPVEGIDRLSTEVAVLYPKAVFFVSKLVFQRLNWFHRLLQGGTSDAIRSRLEKKGFPVTVIPVVIPMMAPGR